MASMFGALVSVVALVLSVALVVLKIVHGIPLVGWTSLIVTVLFLGGVQLICVGILGEYVGRIYDEVRQRPPYVVAEVLGKTRLDVGPPRNRP
jgi:dolichol-phosphate mannosyltransferase